MRSESGVAPGGGRRPTPAQLRRKRVQRSQADMALEIPQEITDLAPIVAAANHRLDPWPREIGNRSVAGHCRGGGD